MATYEQIRKASETIKYMTIERFDKKQNKTVKKEYAEVHQRIKAFRMVYPEGFIFTEMLSNENGICVFRAKVGRYDEDGNPLTLGTGTAFESQNASIINKTSYVENCETSAVGRALGMAGFGIDHGFASFDEVNNAINQQEQLDGKAEHGSEPKKEEPKKKESTNTQQRQGKSPVTAEERQRLVDYCKQYNIDMGWIAERVGVKDGNMTAPQYAKAMGIINDIISRREKHATD